ncbi:SRPBCC family protein [Serinicoccus marinus]|uniref:SRPBCC family protein n=1 Tax=Serinicoccus marinus TaxID=247333 RepID=UPI002491B69F|nr:SRPBCC domain-containing protein [Serinicoccus marinus]
MSESTITISRHVPVDAARAFRAWVDPAELARWWWPQWPDTTYEIDARQGGEVRIHSAEVGMGITGTFLDFDPPRGFTMTWVWGDDSRQEAVVEDTVDVRFVEGEDGTEVTVRHTSTEHVPDGGAEQGWNDMLDRLPGHLSG